MGCFPNRFSRRWQFLTSVIRMPASIRVVRGLQQSLVWLFSLEQHAEALSALCLFCKQWLMSFIAVDAFFMTQQRSVSQRGKLRLQPFLPVFLSCFDFCHKTLFYYLSPLPTASEGLSGQVFEGGQSSKALYVSPLRWKWGVEKCL